ncbi:MAG: carboxypeptidase regulatory-like domain-containing protein, partial [Gemmatimonadetes bacterium]|nr:carboxypeptidase regulatory-like domain-containing protein [Gemmatimonadota bacterium]
MRGTVVLPDGATRAAGVIVTASDTLGHVRVNGLASERGEYDLALPAPGTYIVRALRIGFRPTTLPAIVVAAGETRDLPIVLGGEAVTLARVTVRGERVCRIREDSGRLVARVWEEARKAMLASRLAVEAHALDTRWFVYDRTLDAQGRMVKAQKVTLRSGNTARPFSAESPEVLEATGYVTQDGADVWYHAPDEAVLLSDLFASTHCFALEPPPEGGADWVGVGFRPSRDREGISDITGTLWLDRATDELRLIELRYTGLPRAYDEAGVGARVE